MPYSSIIHPVKTPFHSSVFSVDINNLINGQTSIKKNAMDVRKVQ